MIYIIDANIAIKWTFQETFSEIAERIAEESLIAPDFILVEAANVIWKKYRKGEINISLIDQCLLDIKDAISSFILTTTIFRDSLQIAATLDHPVYDCIYLATAIHTQHPLVTADKTFYHKVDNSKYSPSVMWIEDFDSNSKNIH